MNIDILIGDDLFAWPAACGAIETTLAQIQGKLAGHKISYTTESVPSAVIKEAATGKYNVVVTDLDYEFDMSRKEGYGVVDAVAAMTPKPLLILCTSSDRVDRSRLEGKIDYLVTDGTSNKFDALVDRLAAHYGSVTHINLFIFFILWILFYTGRRLF